MKSADCTRIRKSGVKKLVVNGVAALVAVRAAGFILGSIDLDDSDEDIPLAALKWFGLVLPVSFGLGALIEVITGVEFAHLSYKWSRLAGWQRGLFGFALVVVAALVSGVLSVAVG